MTTIVAMIAAMASKNNKIDIIFSFLFILTMTFALKHLVFESRQANVNPKQSADYVVGIY